MRHLLHRCDLENEAMSNGMVGRTYGTVSADWQKEMSGLQFVQGLADGTLPLNTIAKPSRVCENSEP
jgi:hypothetical protein